MRVSFLLASCVFSLLFILNSASYAETRKIGGSSGSVSLGESLYVQIGRKFGRGIKVSQQNKPDFLLFVSGLGTSAGKQLNKVQATAETVQTEGRELYFNPNANSSIRTIPVSQVASAKTKDIKAALATDGLVEDIDVENRNEFIVVVPPEDLCEETDRDGINDCYERQHGLNPQKKDSDGDGLGDYAELIKYKTDANSADTDGDGVSDIDEIAQLSNPVGQGSASAEMQYQWSQYPTHDNGPVISVALISLNGSVVTVSVQTDKPADLIVNFGPDARYGSYLSDFAFADSHTMSFRVPRTKIVHLALRSCTPRPDWRCSTTEDLFVLRGK